MLGRTAAQEHPGRPFTGFKLAHAGLAAGDGRAAFGGVSVGAQRVYGAVAEASCVWSRRHDPPKRWCDCGFYCFHSLADARALRCATEHRAAVLLEVAASGRFIRYERGLRYSRQRVRSVRVGSCGCGRPAAGLVDAGEGVPGWCRLMPACAVCGAGRPLITFDGFAARIGGPVPVVRDEDAVTRAARAVDGRTAPGGPAPGGLTESDPIAALGAEIAFLNARLDHLQTEVSRLGGGI